MLILLFWMYLFLKLLFSETTRCPLLYQPGPLPLYTNQDHHHPNLGPVVCVCPPPLYIQNADRTKLQTSPTCRSDQGEYCEGDFKESDFVLSSV